MARTRSSPCAMTPTRSWKVSPRCWLMAPQWWSSRLPAKAPAPGRGAKLRRLVEHLEQARATLAAADAHGDDRVLDLAATPGLLEDLAGEPRAGHPERMADGDRAAVDVVLFRVDAQGVAAVETLAGESLVELPQ